MKVQNEAGVDNISAHAADVDDALHSIRIPHDSGRKPHRLTVQQDGAHWKGNSITYTF